MSDTQPLDQFKPATKNANRHTQRGLKALADAMGEVGYVAPITAAADGEVLDGSARLETAFDKFGNEAIVIHHTGTKPIIMVRDDIPNAHTPAAKKIAYGANRIAQLDLDFDPIQIAADLEAGIDLSDLWQPEELSAILEAAGTELLGGNGQGQDPEPQIDRAAELQEKWQVKPGDLWLIPSKTMPGKTHRLLCGDCRNPGDVSRLLDGQKVNGVFTSPPYAEQRKKQYGGVPTAEYVEWWEAVQANVRANLAEDGSFFVNIKPHCEDGQRVLYVFDLVLAMVRGWGWKFAEEFCWRRVSLPGQWSNRFKNNFEPIYQFAANDWKFIPENSIQPFLSDKNKMSVTGNHLHVDFVANGGHPGGVRSKEYNGALPSNVIDASFDGTIGHAAAFPVALPTFFIKAYSDPLDSWYDPFMGSGTVFVACENEKRIGYGTELKPEYCAVILERLQQLTGQSPQLLEG